MTLCLQERPERSDKIHAVITKLRARDHTIDPTECATAKGGIWDWLIISICQYNPNTTVKAVDKGSMIRVKVLQVQWKGSTDHVTQLNPFCVWAGLRAAGKSNLPLSAQFLEITKLKHSQNNNNFDFIFYIVLLILRVYQTPYKLTRTIATSTSTRQTKRQHRQDARTHATAVHFIHGRWWRIGYPNGDEGSTQGRRDR